MIEIKNGSRQHASVEPFAQVDKLSLSLNRANNGGFPTTRRHMGTNSTWQSFQQLVLSEQEHSQTYADAEESLSIASVNGSIKLLQAQERVPNRVTCHCRSCLERRIVVVDYYQPKNTAQTSQSYLLALF
jgi:hypothetical protein